MNRTDYRTARALIRGNGFAYVYRLNWELQPDGSQRFDPMALRALEQLTAERDYLQVRANAVRCGANRRERIVLYCPRHIFAASRIGRRLARRLHSLLHTTTASVSIPTTPQGTGIMKFQTDLDQVVALLNAESVRLFSEPLDDEQTEAVFDEAQCFSMIDDMESRMGFNVTDARRIAAGFYGIDPCDDVPANVTDSLIGSLAEATLEPLTDAPHSDGSHVTLDARNVDHWSRNHGR